MTSQKPYLVRAIYEWLLDNQLTPYLIVDAGFPGTRVPTEHIQDDNQIVLNLAPSAIQGLSMDNDMVIFNARFAGVPRQLMIPVEAIKAVVSRENGQGMQFAVDYTQVNTDNNSDDGNVESKLEEAATDAHNTEKPSEKPTHSHLTVIK